MLLMLTCLFFVMARMDVVYSGGQNAAAARKGMISPSEMSESEISKALMEQAMEQQEGYRVLITAFYQRAAAE